MKRVGKAIIVLAGVTGTVDVSLGNPWEGPRRNNMAAANRPSSEQSAPKPAVGPWGEPVTAMPKPLGQTYPTANAPLQPAIAQAHHLQPQHGHANGVVQASASCSGPGVCTAPGHAHGVAAMPPSAAAMPSSAPAAPTSQRSQLRFVGPAKAKIGWYVPIGGVDAASGQPLMTSYQVAVPGVYNFLQASLYRLKLSEIPGREGINLYPTIEVVPANAKTIAFLAHNFIPVEFTEEDFDQVTAGNFITKVIYLPDPQFQSPVGAGPEELVSTRLDPGVDPIAEAHRRGNILLVIRMGGIDLEAERTPPVDGKGMYGPPRPLVSPQPTMVPNGAPMPGHVPAVLRPEQFGPESFGATIPAGMPSPMVPAGAQLPNTGPMPATPMHMAQANPMPQQFYVPDSRGQMVLVTVMPPNPAVQTMAMPAGPAPMQANGGVVSTFTVPAANPSVQQVVYSQAALPVTMTPTANPPAAKADEKSKRQKPARKGLFNGFGTE